MILPNKNIKVENSLIGIGALLLENCRKAETVSSLWEKVKDCQQLRFYEKYVFSLDLLYALGLLDYENGLLRRCNGNDKGDTSK